MVDMSTHPSPFAVRPTLRTARNKLWRTPLPSGIITSWDKYLCPLPLAPCPRPPPSIPPDIYLSHVLTFPRWCNVLRARPVRHHAIVRGNLDVGIHGEVQNGRHHEGWEGPVPHQLLLRDASPSPVLLGLHLGEALEVRVVEFLVDLGVHLLVDLAVDLLLDLAVNLLLDFRRCSRPRKGRVGRGTVRGRSQGGERVLLQEGENQEGEER